MGGSWLKLEDAALRGCKSAKAGVGAGGLEKEDLGEAELKE